jgi:hypothetical protein
MSWLFSQALVEAYLEEKSLDGKQSVPLNGNHTQQAYLPPDKMTDFSRLSRFGMTYKHLTESRGEELLMSYLEDFLAKTSAQQDKEQVLEEVEAVCGSTWLESLEKSNQLTLSLKTPLCSALEDSVLSSKTLPHWGTMLNGECYHQAPLALITSGQECGSLLPTPTCHNAKEGAYPAEYTRKTPTLATHVGGKIHPEFTEWMMGWPLGWTDLKPLETAKYPCVLQPLGQC